MLCKEGARNGRLRLLSVLASQTTISRSKLGRFIPHHPQAEEGSGNRCPPIGVQPHTALPVIISYSCSYQFLVYRFPRFEVDGGEIPFRYAAAHYPVIDVHQTVAQRKPEPADAFLFGRPYLLAGIAAVFIPYGVHAGEPWFDAAREGKCMGSPVVLHDG